MEQRGNLKLYTLEEVTDEIIGKKGTAERDEFDRDVEEALKAYQLRETSALVTAISSARRES